MPSKTSKRSRNRSLPQPPASPLWKAESACSEPRLAELARLLARELSVGHRVLLEGPMGAGKTTFSRILLEGLGVVQPPEGSPSFAIAHEYRGARSEVIHIDFYRIRSEAEIEEAGIEAYFWERDAVVVAEWASLWPGFESAVLKSASEQGRQVWKVDLAFADAGPDFRNIEIRRVE